MPCTALDCTVLYCTVRNVIVYLLRVCMYVRTRVQLLSCMYKALVSICARFYLFRGFAANEQRYISVLEQLGPEQSLDTGSLRTVRNECPVWKNIISKKIGERPEKSGERLRKARRKARRKAPPKCVSIQNCKLPHYDYCRPS